MTQWKEDKRWSDRFIPEIKAIIGQHLIREAYTQEDQLENTDLICLTLASIRIACRIRRYQFYHAYPDDFTIRSGRPGNTTTELAKILAGWGDYFFYGFANEAEDGLQAWLLGRLDVFREWYPWAESNGQYCGELRINGDYSSCFKAFDLTIVHSDFAREFIVARDCLKEQIMTNSPVEHDNGLPFSLRYVAGQAEVEGNIMQLEWRSNRDIPDDLRARFERTTRVNPITIFIVEGDAETMEVDGFAIAAGGKIGECPRPQSVL